MKIPFNKTYTTGQEIVNIGKAIANGKLAGDGEFTLAVQQMMESRYGIDKTLLTTSCTDALEMCAILTGVDSESEVIMPSYTFVSTANAFALRGAKIVFVDSEENTPNLDADKLEELITPKTKAIIINSPHNPTGTVMSDEEMLQLQEILRNTKIFLISDEVYEHMTYDGLQHNSALKYPELFARSFVCFSLGKVYNCTGWKLGYCIAPENLSKEFRKVHQFNVFSCDTPKQLGIAKYMSNKEAYLTLGNFYQEKRDYLRALLKDTPLVPIPSSGSYFESYSYASISNESDTIFAEKLVTEYGIATIPMSAFYQDGTDHKVIRLCFAKQKETLEAAAACLQKLKN